MKLNYYHFSQLKKWVAFMGGFIPVSITTQYHKNKVNDYYVNNIMTFDTETTTVFNYGEKWGRYYYEKDVKNFKNSDDKNLVDYNELEKHTLVYLWTFSIYSEKWDVTFYGRTNNDFYDFIIELKNILENQERKNIKMIIYVHNLGFDFTNSLQNIFTFEKVFARKPHKPMYCDTTENISFRCSYMLTNSSLKNLTKDNIKYKKKIDFDDYLKVRTPKSNIDDVIEYAVLDTLSLAESLQKELDFYKNIYKIPLTSTGKLRREVKEYNKNNTKALSRDKTCFIMDVNFLKILLKTFQGGDTHANIQYVNIECNNVDSFDIKSSYPAQMIFQKYPCTPFHFEKIENYLDYINNENFCSIGLYAFSGVSFNGIIPYLKSSKSEKLSGNVRYDNGRIWKCDYCEFYLTDIDYELVMKSYKIEKIECKELYVAQKDYLTDTERFFILENYEKKTKLKGLEDRKEDYMRSKNNINSEFGRNVQKPFEQEIIYDNNLGWIVEELTDEKIEKILKDKKGKEHHTMYARGIYITAYARKELYNGIEFFGKENHIYNDTDSCKGFLTDEILEKFKNRNLEIIEKIKTVCTSQKMVEMCMPTDIKGNTHILGTWDFETENDTYKRFKTFGSKKYIYEDNAGLNVTVSGLSKNSVSSLNFDDIKIGTLFNSKISGRSIAVYQEEQPIAIIDGYVSTQKYSLSIVPTTYNLGLTDEFSEIIYEIQHCI